MKYNRYILVKNLDFKLKILILFLLYFIVYQIVIFTGGTKNVYPHLIYIPILVSSLFFKFQGAFLGGIIGGIIMGIIPLDTLTNERQHFITTLIRASFLTLIGTFSAYLFDTITKQCEDLEKSNEYDIITTLPNRIMLVKDLEQLLKEKRKYILVTVLIENIIEIFNIIGQSKSSLVLKSISQYFQEATLEFKTKIYNSYSLRFEFLLEISNEYEINMFLEDFKHYINTFPININAKSIYLKTYFGVSILEKNKDSDRVINEAYQALDFAYKNSNDYCIFNENLNNKFLTTFLLSQIEDAIKNNDFYLEYQPKLNLKNNKVEEVEALIRWKHPNLGIIPPNEFIPKLEKTDAINKLTNWVIRRAIEDIVYLEKKGIELNVSVNISPRDLAKDNFNVNLLKELKKYSLTSDRLNLEITETDLIKDMDLVIKNLNLLKLRGIKISMDDFGSGYSSLSYISLLPLDYVKIDRSLIKNIFKNRKNQDLLKNTIEMLHILKKIVVAEGIEDLETLEYLKELNCELAQGFYISKPISRKDLEIFMNKRNDYLREIVFEEIKTDNFNISSV